MYFREGQRPCYLLDQGQVTMVHFLGYHHWIDPIDPICTWLPPMPLIIWDILVDEVIFGAKQTVYGHYAMLHNQIIKAQGGK